MKNSITLFSIILFGASLFFFSFKNSEETKARKHIIMEVAYDGFNIYIKREKKPTEKIEPEKDNIHETVRLELDNFEKEGYELISQSHNAAWKQDLYIFRSK